MDSPSPPSWVPTFLLALLALHLLWKALRAGARRTWGWGRTLEAAPISRRGYAALSVTFMVIAAMAAWSPGPPPLLLMVSFGICIVAVGVAGFVDTRAWRRSLAHGNKDPEKPAGRGTGLSLSTLRCLGEDPEEDR